MSDKTKCPEKTNEAAHGSKTMTITQSEEKPGKPEKINITVTEKEPRRRVTFTDETVDNEHMGKKSSKGIHYFKLKYILNCGT